MSLTEVFNNYFSDKGSLFEGHMYSKDYEKLIDKNIEFLLEIGVGADWSNDKWQDPLGNCASIRAWLEWLPNTTVYGFDINNKIKDLKDHPRFKFLQGNQNKKTDLIRLKNFIPDCDVIIDDGSHFSYDQLLTFVTLWDKVKPGGYYFIEDVHCRWGFPPHTKNVLRHHDNYMGTIGIGKGGIVLKKGLN